AALPSLGGGVGEHGSDVGDGVFGCRALVVGGERPLDVRGDPDVVGVERGRVEVDWLARLVEDGFVVLVDDEGRSADGASTGGVVRLSEGVADGDHADMGGVAAVFGGVRH